MSNSRIPVEKLWEDDEEEYVWTPAEVIAGALITYAFCILYLAKDLF